MIRGDLVQLLEQAALLMVLGMVIVFAILGLMVLMINLVARLLARWAPAVDEPDVAMATAASTAAPSAVEVAAISAAIHHHRQQSAKENRS